jgi:hypothetical protein
MISSKKLKVIFDYYTENGEEAASEYFDISMKSLKRYISLYRQYEREGIKEKQDGSVEVTATVNTKLTNVFEAMDYGKLDPTAWRPHRVDYNQRADGSLQFKAAFVPIAGDVKESPEAYMQKFVDFVQSYKVPVFDRVVVDSENILATISAADWHHGKQVWGKEISGGGENWDIHESRSEFENYIAYAKMRIAPYRPDTIVLELLGDWFNVDSPSNTTVSGTVQSEDSRFIKTQAYAEQMLVDAIESLHTICNKVVVMIVPGNHDATRILMLGRFIQAYYRNDSSIEIMCEPTTRKKIRWGTTLLGYSHELKGEIVQNMFSLWPRDCAECTDLIMNTGHFHTYKKMIPMCEYNQSVKVVQHPAMVPEDAWSSSEGYYHKREGLIRLFDYDMGQIAEFGYKPQFMRG